MKQIISTKRSNMKLTPFFVLSIMLFSCSGNGNKSEKNQEIIDMDSTESVVIDTMVTSPIESKEKAEESTRVKTKRVKQKILLLEHFIVQEVATLMSSTMIIQECSLQEVEVEQHTIGV